MSIDCAFFGFLAADSERRTSQAGKSTASLFPAQDRRDLGNILGDPNLGFDVGPNWIEDDD